MNDYLLLKITLLEHATDNSACRTVEDVLTIICDPAPSPTPTNTPTNTPTITPTITNTPTVTPTISITPTITPTISNTPTNTPTITLSPTATITPSPTNILLLPPILSFDNINNQLYYFNLNDSNVLIQTQKSYDNGSTWEDILPYISVNANSNNFQSYTDTVTNTKFRARVFSSGSGSQISAWSYNYTYSAGDIAAPVINYNSTNNSIYLFNVNDFNVVMLVEKSEDGLSWYNVSSNNIDLNANSSRTVSIIGSNTTQFRARAYSAGLGTFVSDWSYVNRLAPSSTPTNTPTVTRTVTPTVTPSVTPTLTPTSTPNFFNSLTILAGNNYISGNGLTFSGNPGDKLEYAAQNGFDLPATMNILVGGIIKNTIIFPSAIYMGKLFRVTLNGISYTGNFISGSVSFN